MMFNRNNPGALALEVFFFLASSLPLVAHADSRWVEWSALGAVQSLLGTEALSAHRVEVGVDSSEGRVRYAAYASVNCSGPASGGAKTAACTYFSGENWNGVSLARIKGSDGAKIFNALIGRKDSFRIVSGAVSIVSSTEGQVVCSIPATVEAARNDPRTLCGFGSSSD